MDKIISKYFCIFCETCTQFETMNESYDHYKQHMKSVYYCLDCDNDRKCSEKHSSEHQRNSKEEEGLIEMWIERFLSYQKDLIGKSYSVLFRSSRLFTGCAVCQTFLRICDSNGITIGPKDIQWSHNESPSNETRHVCSHLRYYPFECFKCENVGKYHKKCDMSEITRHIRDCHSTALKETNLNTLVKCCPIPKVESYIKYGITNRITGSHTGAKAQTTPVTPTRISQRISSQPPKPVVVVTEPKPKRPRIEAQIVVANDESNNCKTIERKDTKSTTICVQKSDTFLTLNRRKSFSENKKKNNIYMKTNDKKVINSFVKSVPKSAAKVEIKFKPIVKTYSNSGSGHLFLKSKQNNLISGDQIIIKKVPEVTTKAVKGISIINRSTPILTAKLLAPTENKFSLSQQFSDMMGTDMMGTELKGSDLMGLDILSTDMMGTDMNGDVLQMPDISTKNIEYFCVFCTEKMTTKETTHQHIQRHLDYYPIVCLTCGEGLTDLPSFIKHHKETHAEAVKGRYKKKEQPVVDKWITAFLNSQTTILRTFPPRECCPICDRIYTRPEVMSNKPRRCTINRKIDHLYRHISYLPYECILCRDSGQEFTVAYFESKAHSHIKLKHPEIDDNESRWQVFQKTITIPKLDEFVDNYLTQFGISMEYERRPIKKSMKYCSAQELEANMDSNPLDSSSLNLNMIFSDIIDSSVSPKVNSNSGVIDMKPEIDLMITDDNNESTLLNEVNNNSNDSNIVVNVSPQNLLDKSISDDDCEEEVFFCVFCSDCEDMPKMEAYSHYGSHLEYFPVLCKICSNNFPDVDHLMSHHQSVHSTQANVDYEICEDQVLIKWVNEFLDSQLSYKKVMPCSCSYNCPVCVKLVGDALPESAMPCGQHNDVLFSVHIHKHLNYFPYECITCKRNGRSVRVPNLDAMAMNHLKEHKIESASMTQVVKNFPKTLVIPQLEKLIGDSVHRKRVSEKKNRLDLNPFIGLQQTLPNTNPIQLNDSLSIIPLNTEPSTSTSTSHQNKKQHIRLEGGRVVNLPPKTSASDNGTNYLANTNGNESETKGMVIKVVNYRCVHCSKYFINKSLFKLHHNQSHPGKPLLCSKSSLF